MADVQRWLWIRHGPTHLKTLCGWSDPPADLSDKSALARLAEGLPSGGQVVSSDLLRARSTADCVMGQRTRLPDAPKLREIHFGAWEGLRFDEVNASHPELCKAFWEEPGDVRSPGGEAWNDMSDRVSAFVDGIADCCGPAIVAVAHMGTILSQVARATGEVPREVVARKIDNLSLTELAFDGQWHLVSINRSF